MKLRLSHLLMKLVLANLRRKLLASLNLTHASPSSSLQPNSDQPALQSTALSSTGADASQFCPNCGHGGTNGIGGREGRFSHIQCQLCFKSGHLATSWRHRFNQNFQATVSSNYQGFPANYRLLHSQVSHRTLNYGPNASGYGPPFGYEFFKTQHASCL